MLTKVQRAENEIKRVVDYIYENDWLLKTHNLKLYDACYYEGSEEFKKEFPNLDKNNSEYFCDWCELCRIWLDEFTNEENINFDDCITRIGRTSSFYFDSKFIELYQRKLDIDATICNIIEYYYGGLYGIDINEDGSIRTLVEGMDWYDAENELDYIIEDLYNDFVNSPEMEDVTNLYEGIKDFKENQVENFKIYLEGEAEDWKEMFN